MGQKCNPIGLRIGIKNDSGIIPSWNDIYYSSDKNEYKERLYVTILTREFFAKQPTYNNISDLKVEVTKDKVKIVIYTPKPGLVIGQKGAGIDNYKKNLAKKLNFDINKIDVSIVEVKDSELLAPIVAKNIAMQIEKRVSYKRAMKMALQNSMKQGAQGIKIKISGRLGGAEIARSEWGMEGRVPLHTFKSNISYASEEAHTTYGVIGVKVWICRKPKK